MFNREPKFEWEARESAPEYYPMEIIAGTFVFKGEAREGLYIPSGGTLESRWGKPISSHSSIKHSLPDRLRIAFFSYPEKQFYQGEFELPYDKMVALFKEGVAVHKAGDDIFPSYSSLVAGIAPGGVVAVWLSGRKRTEVFFGKAEKVDLEPSHAFQLPFDSDEEADQYMIDGLEETISAEQLAHLRTHGIPFDLWSRYRNRYNWQPVIKGDYQLKTASMRFVNGEVERNKHIVSIKNQEVALPVPLRVSFKVPGYIYEMYFEEFETMAAFEQLGANGEPVFVEYDLAMPRSNSKVRVYNDKGSIDLHKTRFTDW